MATRFYLPSSTISPAVPITASTDWEDTSAIVRGTMSTTKSSSAMANSLFSDADTTNKDCILKQFISANLTAGQTITGSQSLKLQILGIENDTGCNMFLAVGLRVIAGDSASVQKVMLAVTRDGLELDASALTNRQFTATSAATNYTTVAGDKLVLEIGAGGDPSVSTDHTHQLRFGDDSATDLPEDDTDGTQTKNPWLQLTDTLTFVSGTGSAARVHTTAE